MFASATGCNDTHFRVTKENLKERAGSRHSGSGSHSSSDSLMAVIVVQAVVIVIVVVGSSSSSSSSCRCCCNVVVALFPLLLSLPSSGRQ